MRKIQSILTLGSTVLALAACDPKPIDTIRNDVAVKADTTLEVPEDDKNEDKWDFLDNHKPLLYSQRKDMNNGILLTDKVSQDKLTFFGTEMYRLIDKLPEAKNISRGKEIIFRQNGKAGYYRAYAEAGGYFSYTDNTSGEAVTWFPHLKQLTIGRGGLSCSNGHSQNFVCYLDTDSLGISIPTNNIYRKLLEMNLKIGRLQNK